MSLPRFNMFTRCWWFHAPCSSTHVFHVGSCVGSCVGFLWWFLCRFIMVTGGVCHSRGVTAEVCHRGVFLWVILHTHVITCKTCNFVCFVHKNMFHRVLPVKGCFWGCFHNSVFSCSCPPRVPTGDPQEQQKNRRIRRHNRRDREGQQQHRGPSIHVFSCFMCFL